MSPGEQALSDVFNPETAVHPLDLTDAVYHTENPWPVYNWLMDEAPLYQDSNGFWYVSRYDDLKALAMDPVTFTSTEGNRPGLPNDHSFIHLDGKGHHARRGLIQHLFTPAAIKKLDGHITDVVDTLLDEVIESGECDFVEDVAAKLPMQLIGEMTGTPPEMWDEIRGWLDVFVTGGQGPQYVTEDVNEMFLRFGALHMDLVDERRANPKDDLLSLWANASIDGEPLTDDDILWEHTMMTVGGSETTRNSVSGGILAMLENPDQREFLAQNPKAIGNAIDEILRWTTPFIGMSRTLTRDVTLHGKTMAKGEQVVLLWPAGNRDPRRFENPQKFDLQRQFTHRMLAFGLGHHVCLGEHLARMETRIVIERLFARMPDFQLNGTPEKSQSSFIRGLKTLPLRFTPGPRVRS